MAQDPKMRTGGSGPTGRPPLEPTEPLALGTALIQVALLLGIPVLLLLLAKVVMNQFFPGVTH